MTRRPPRLVALLSLVALAVLAGVATGRSSAWAHAALRTSSPAAGERVTLAPAEVTMTFSEQIDPRYAQVTVRGPSGASVLDAGPIVDGTTARQRIDSTTNGAYQVEYRVVAQDGDPVTGSLIFIVDTPTTAQSTATSTVGRSPVVVAPVGEAVSPSRPVPEQRTTATNRRLSYPVAAIMVALLLALAARTLWRRRDGGQSSGDPSPSSDLGTQPHLRTRPSGPTNG